MQRHRRHPARQVPAQATSSRARRRQRLRLLRRGVRLGLAATTSTTTRRSPAGSTAFPTRWRGWTWTRTATCPGTAASTFFLGEFINADGSPYPVCPRQTLKRVLKRAEKLGFQVMTGMEYEWFNFRETPQSWAAKKGVGPETLTPGMFGYSLLRVNQNREFFNALMDEMLAFDVPIEGLHTETGPGVYEAAIGFSARRWSRPTARSCSRPAPRRSARASASCPASWPSGARSTRAAAATSTRACRTARPTCSTTRSRRAR